MSYYTLEGKLQMDQRSKYITRNHIRARRKHMNCFIIGCGEIFSKYSINRVNNKFNYIKI